VDGVWAASLDSGHADVVIVVVLVFVALTVDVLVIGDLVVAAVFGGVLKSVVLECDAPGYS